MSMANWQRLMPRRTEIMRRPAIISIYRELWVGYSLYRWKTCPSFCHHHRAQLLLLCVRYHAQLADNLKYHKNKLSIYKQCLSGQSDGRDHGVVTNMAGSHAQLKFSSEFEQFQPFKCTFWARTDKRTDTHTHKAKPIHPRYAGCNDSLNIKWQLTSM